MSFVLSVCTSEINTFYIVMVNLLPQFISLPQFARNPPPQLARSLEQIARSLPCGLLEVSYKG